MQQALQQAKEGGCKGEVPIGALLVKDGKLLAKGANNPISSNDPTAHAEIVVLRKGAAVLQNYRLPGTTLYVTLEPCIMCMGAMIQARVERLVYGASDPKSGAVSSKYSIATDGLLNHNIAVTGAVLQEECGDYLRSFFRNRRLKKSPHI